VLKVKEQIQEMKLTVDLKPAAPLWQRAPTRDHQGRMLSDFMMIIPELKIQPSDVILRTVTDIENTLNHYQKHVVFADLNLKLNVLWVSIRPKPGLCLELATAINFVVPEAKLVAQKVWARE
jgi:hypothetical protein